jgi:hypothetical protein
LEHGLDVVLMRSDPLDIPVALAIGHGTLRRMRQDLGSAIGYNTIALPIAAGAFVSLGLALGEGRRKCADTDRKRIARGMRPYKQGVVGSSPAASTLVRRCWRGRLVMATGSGAIWVAPRRRHRE